MDTSIVLRRPRDDEEATARDEDPRALAKRFCALPRKAALDAGSVLRLDPRRVAIPSTPNRLPDSFANQAYEQLRSSIRAAGGNVEPILVRKVDGDEERYVLICGERRLRACVAEGMPVLAVLTDAGDDNTDFLARMRGNLGNHTLSNWEFGLQVRYILQANPALTRVKLAEALGVSVAKISRAHDLGNLPDTIVNAFVSPSEIRIDDMKVLRDAWAAAPEAIELEAACIREEANTVKGPDVVRRLQKAATKASGQFALCKPVSSTRAPQSLVCGDRRIGQWQLGATGGTELVIDVQMSEVQREGLMKLVSDFVGRKVLAQPRGRRRGNASQAEMETENALSVRGRAVSLIHVPVSMGGAS